jgi:hypothetical protein
MTSRNRCCLQRHVLVESGMSASDRRAVSSPCCRTGVAGRAACGTRAMKPKRFSAGAVVLRREGRIVAVSDAARLPQLGFSRRAKSSPPKVRSLQRGVKSKKRRRSHRSSFLGRGVLRNGALQRRQGCPLLSCRSAARRRAACRTTRSLDAPSIMIPLAQLRRMRARWRRRGCSRFLRGRTA